MLFKGTLCHSKWTSCRSSRVLFRLQRDLRLSANDAPNPEHWRNFLNFSINANKILVPECPLPYL
uniref:Uncharacterized protein MANES_05G163300 n=1 Tax=Rhizophora mucronata TaxID=61149 RepID=A0A2P2L9S4_RHIMU